MPRNKIYVWNNGDYDHTRWVSLAFRGQDTCVLHLSDACHPGRLSRLTSVVCPANYLKAAMGQGTLQITLPNGFLLIQRHDDIVHLDFRGRDEATSVKGSFRTQDFLDRIACAEQEADELAVTV